MKIVLEIVGSEKTKFYQISKQEVILGRDPDKCDIVLSEEGASKAHCRLEFHNEKWWVVDLGSKNGTFVNKQSIKRHVLYLDDIVQIGDYYLRLASTKMSLTTNQLLRKPGKEYSPNKSITLVQKEAHVKERLFDGAHHGMKEVTMIGERNNLAKGRALLEKKKAKKKRTG